MKKLGFTAVALGISLFAACQQPEQNQETTTTPAAEQTTPQTVAPGAQPGAEPLPRSAPGVLQDSLEQPDRPGPAVSPGI